MSSRIYVCYCSENHIHAGIENGNECDFFNSMHKMENLEKRLRSEMDSVLGISARIKLVEPKTIARTEGKAKREMDRSEL